MKILFFGDIIGKVGRRAIKKALPTFKKTYQPDLIIANGENLAHGAGITRKILQEMREAGIDLFTSGNHVLSKPEAMELLSETDGVLIRPANYPVGFPGLGYKIVPVGTRQLLVINLLGRVFMDEKLDCPFKKFDEILAQVDQKNLDGVIVDFHAEATSEKVAFGWYADGRASAVLGTHTHIPTADATILPAGTAYVTDVGMNGPYLSVLGMKSEVSINRFLTGEHIPYEIAQTSEVWLNYIELTVDTSTQKAVKIE